MELKSGVKISVVLVLLFHSSTARRKPINSGKTHFSNDVIIEEEFETITPREARRIVNYILENNKVPEDVKMPFLPSEIIERARLELKKDDPYFLSDLQLEIAPNSINGDHFDSVSLHNGVLIGISDFRNADDPKVSKDPSQLFLIWKRLRVSYKVTVNNDGLQFNGEMDMRVGQLFMHIQRTNKATDSSNIEMSKFRELETKIDKLHEFSEDFRTAVRSESEDKIRHHLNGKIRAILLRVFKDAIDDNSVDNHLSPLIGLSEEYYEVYFR